MLVQYTRQTLFDVDWIQNLDFLECWSDTADCMWVDGWIEQVNFLGVLYNW